MLTFKRDREKEHTELPDIDLREVLPSFFVSFPPAGSPTFFSSQQFASPALPFPPVLAAAPAAAPAPAAPAPQPLQFAPPLPLPLLPAPAPVASPPPPSPDADASSESSSPLPKKKRHAGLSKSTDKCRNNNRVCLRGVAFSRRCVFDVTAVTPPVTVEIQVVHATITQRVTKKNAKTALCDAGDAVQFLAVHGAADPLELPTTGKIWLVTARNGAQAVDASLFVSALSDLRAGTQRFTVSKLGVARRHPQESGTRTKRNAQVVDCYCIEFPCEGDSSLQKA